MNKFKTRGKIDLEGIKLTCNNHMRLAWLYRKEHNLKTKHLEDVVAHMLNNGYYLDGGFAKGGAPDFYLEVFGQSCEIGRLTWKSQNTRNLWRAPRQTW